MGIKEWWLVGRVVHFLLNAWDGFIDVLKKYKNRIKWLYKYYIDGEKGRKYIVDKRVSKNVIYCNGHLIVLNEYTIFMLDNSDFNMKKGFKTSNSSHTDFSNITENKNCSENRFNSCIVRAETLNKKVDGTLQITNLKSTKKTIKFEVNVDARRRFEVFNFGLYLSLPKEFYMRNNLDDLIMIKENIYGKFELELKIDKDAPQRSKFAPFLAIDEEYLKPEITEDLFYIGRKWKIIKLFSTINNIKISHKKA